MIRSIFELVANILYNGARMLGITYNELNIIVYIIIIPLVWAYMIDKAYKFHRVKIAYLLFLLLILGIGGTFETNSDRLFIICQRFLCLFYPIGINYTEASVIFCVVAPILIHIALIKILNRVRQKKEITTSHPEVV
jgi:hypothetical protein